jgi:hypothetical protein
MFAVCRSIRAIFLRISSNESRGSRERNDQVLICPRLRTRPETPLLDELDAPPEEVGKMILDMHDVEQGKPSGRVKASEQIDVAVRAVLAPCRGTEEAKPTHAKPAQLRLVCPESVENASIGCAHPLPPGCGWTI